VAVQLELGVRPAQPLLFENEILGRPVFKFSKRVLGQSALKPDLRQARLRAPCTMYIEIPHSSLIHVFRQMNNASFWRFANSDWGTPMLT